MVLPCLLFLGSIFLFCDHWDGIWYLHSCLIYYYILNTSGRHFLELHLLTICWVWVSFCLFGVCFVCCFLLFLFVCFVWLGFFVINPSKFYEELVKISRKGPVNQLWKNTVADDDILHSPLSRSCSLTSILTWGGDEPQKFPGWDNTSMWLTRKVTSIRQTCKKDSTVLHTQAPMLHNVFAPEHPAHLLPSCSAPTFLKLEPFL